MGVDIKANIRGYVKHTDIINFIRQRYKTDVNTDVTSRNYGKLESLTFPFTTHPKHEQDTEWTITGGSIWFNYKGQVINIFYFYSNINTFENRDYYEKHNLLNMVNSETTHLSMCIVGDITIIEDIIRHFSGGWLDRNDCDDIPYEPIPADNCEDIKPIRTVTLQEVYEKFGEVVIIEDM